MKTVWCALALAVSVAASVGAEDSAPAAPAAPQAAALPVASIKLPDGFAVKSELALTPETQEKGLMYRTEMPEDRGMLFVFPKQGWVQFWMKNTWMDLDMVFIDKDKKITKVYHRVPRSYPGWPDDRVAKVPGFGLYVLELTAGTAKKHRLRKDQVLAFSLPEAGAEPAAASTATLKTP